jgi:hypothetical protein
VKCHNRKNRTLDFCHGTIPNALSATTRPPLGTSDHNVVYLRPTYCQLLEREKPTVKTVQIWNDKGITCLQGCFDCTMWEVFGLQGCFDCTMWEVFGLQGCFDYILCGRYLVSRGVLTVLCGRYLVSRGVLTVLCGRYLRTAALIWMNSQTLFQTNVNFCVESVLPLKPVKYPLTISIGYQNISNQYLIGRRQFMLRVIDRL